MSFIGWLGGRFVFAASMAGVATFGGGALGGLLFGSLCRTLTSSETGEPAPVADAICGSFLGFGTVCLGVAIAIGGFVTVLGRRRSRSVCGSPSEGAWRDDGRRARPTGVQPAPVAWLLVLALILSATAVATWLAGSPTIQFLAHNFTSLGKGLGGLVLMPPGFTLGTTGTLLLGELGLLLLLSARSPLFPRMYVSVAAAHLGLIVCNRSMLEAVRSITGPAGSELPILQAIEAVLATAVPGLTWSLIAHAGGMPLLMFEGVRALFSARHPAERVRPRPFPALAPSEEPMIAAAMPQAARSSQPAGGIRPALGTKYSLRATFLAWPLAGRVRVDDREEGTTFTASLMPLSPWPTVQVWWKSPREEVRIVTMESRHVLGLGNEFDVRDGVTREPLAVVKKPFAAEWLIYSPTGDLMAVVAKEHGGFGQAEFMARVGERPVASLTWSNVMRPALEVDLSTDAERLLDRRVGVALGVLVFMQLSFLSR